MPIWPQTTKAKAALFNKYGRGIIHMGLHEGVDEAISKKEWGKMKRPIIRVQDLHPYLDVLDRIEYALEKETVNFTAISKFSRQTSTSFTFNGSGNDWKDTGGYVVKVETDGPLFVEVGGFYSYTGTQANLNLALMIDGQIDYRSRVRWFEVLTYTAKVFRWFMCANPGRGEHEIKLSIMLEAAKTVTLNLDFSPIRITTIQTKRAY